MPFTESGQNLAGLSKTAAPFLSQVMNMGLTHPISAGVGALSVASGDMSLGETIGTGLTGSAGYLGAQRGATALGRQLVKSAPGLSRYAKFLPGWMKPVGMLAAGLLGASATTDIGKRIGSAVPIYKRKPAEPAYIPGQYQMPGPFQPYE